MATNALFGLMKPQPKSGIELAGVGLNPDTTQALSGLQMPPSIAGPQPGPAPKPMGPSPFAMPQQKPNAINALLDGFQQGFSPQAYQARMQQQEGNAQTKMKQTLALIQQQKALPFEQRAQWWQQNAPQISQIIGQDVSKQPVDPNQFSDQALSQSEAMLAAQLGMGPAVPEQMTPYQQAQIDLEREKMAAPKAPEMRQVGNQIVERQPDGQWKPVFTASTPAEAARAFSSFINKETGHQMMGMSDGSVKDTGVVAYTPPAVMSVGGVPTLTDKVTGKVTQVVPLEEAAGNRAAMASAEVQGQAQGKAAFDLPAIEQRSQYAIRAIKDIQKLDLSSRYALQSKVWAVPGTEGANIQARLNQITSQAFLNAFDQLRGAGAITETEGTAATNAITRLKDQNISVGEALTAMNELIDYYNKGLEVARLKATRGPQLPNRPAAQSGPVQIRTDADYDALPSGAVFIDPDGVKRRKP